ncbi:response regulator transcription factor [Paracoccus laeviglucosivorans]|uniref:Two component transcriptional regulator, LuxR family n=1 Tax=Paracoccus laeviglucosivorans TaxID=1197861 RepID=A0A521BKB3_9RHOB|nr:response regulator transcription factor [Paracoccus laeviglucosivorans]SMO47563.1 two component transcriptional regulator, LuxR family [Paracoccus laeviglucosivorans]
MIRTVSSLQKAVNIAIADGNPLVMSAMSELFVHDSRFSLLSTSSTAEGFLANVGRVPAEVGIIDWALPAMGAAQLLSLLREMPHAPRMVIYGQQGSDAHLGALAAGAAGFVSRSDPVETLLDTCISVAAGKMVFPYLDVRELNRNPMQTLSRRELDMLAALSKGLTNRELARELGISMNTVKFHLSNLYDKLSVKSRAQAIAFFYSNRPGGNIAESGGHKENAEGER